MEQRGRDSDSNQNQQPRRSKEVENQVAPHQPPPPQKCPRCESLNTKFCYYNNYNLAQPRYFCKACRRYWTHGGTLRNVPVGGGCRKGRRGRVSPISCGGESSRSRPFPPQPPPPQSQPPPSQHHPQVDFPNIANMAALVSGIANLPASNQQSLRTTSWAHPPITGSIYPGGIFAAFDGMQLSSLSGQPQGLNRPLRIGGGANAGANMPIFQGFDFSSMKSQQAQSQPLQLRDQPRQSDVIGNRNKDKQPMYTPEENMVLPAGDLNSWTPGDNTTNVTTSNSNFWTNTNGAGTSSGLNETSFNQNEWPNIPDYDDAE